MGMAWIVKSDFLKNYDTNWQGGYVGGVLVVKYNVIFFSKNLHENRV